VEELTGSTVESSRLAETIKIMNDKRRALQRLNDFRKQNPSPISGLDALVVTQAGLNDDPVRFTRHLNILNDELQVLADKGISPFSSKTKRIMSAGCPSVMGNWKLHALIEQAGGAVVVDETCTGLRYFRDIVDEKPADLSGQLNAIADRYIKIDCACFSPNNERIQAISEITKDYSVDGVIQYILQYCHGYNVEAIRVAEILKKENIPNVKIETDYSEEDMGQLRTRIDAFLEQLS
jgi:benzoyl-CoA reductase/2-hydroxyglutaryl-CoA dehydratase subunit BcrC/BadD/HgdB